MYYEYNHFMTQEIIQGIYSQNPNNDFWFIDVPWNDKGYFVFFRNKLSAMDGDTVEAEVRVFKGRKEAIIQKILTRSDKRIIGTLHYPKTQSKRQQPWFGFVIPKSGWTDIFVPGKYSKKARDWDVVAVVITKWEGRNPEWKIEAILGKWDDNIDLEWYILESGFHTSFEENIIREANIKTSSSKPPKGKENKRRDLVNLFTFTIDGEDAKDLDDALSIKKTQNGNYELCVHIADVAEYVTPGSKLDKEAYQRATSVYLADRVLPMLPEQLSNDLCSLNLKWPKKTLTCEMLFSSNGDLKKTKVYESAICNDFRLTYKEVDELLSTQDATSPMNPLYLEGEEVTKPGPHFSSQRRKLHEVGQELFCEKTSTLELLESLKTAHELQSILSKKRNKDGMLHFDFKETKLVLNENKKVVSISEYPKYDSNIMIEQFMISANEAIGQHFANIPFLHRIHPQPNDEDIGTLEKLLHLFWVKFVFKNKDSRDFSRLLSHMNRLPPHELPETSKKVLEKMVLRTLTKAIYSDEREWHFGLGLQYYSHFTSPIRRYPDLQIHRIIKESIHWQLDTKRKAFYENNLSKIAQQCSEQERKAEKLEYKFRDYYICDYYSDKIGECFDGVISWIIPKWIFVELDNTAEWFINFEECVWMVYDQDFMRFEDTSPQPSPLEKRGFQKYYKLWDPITVKLIQIDQQRLRMNFEIV